jgi:hypothetical protein
VNETINFYRKGNSEIKIVSLDATKAFDKLWRAGLFYKLYNKIDLWIWRSLVSYYEKSGIIVKIGKEKSKVVKTTQGVKQGGVLSAYLFNFFINELIEECLKLGIGAKIGNHNVSIVAYCDDILLISPTVCHMNRLVDACYHFSVNWKMEFNPTKSLLTCFGNKTNNFNVSMNGQKIPYGKNFIYLGLPIGDKNFINEYIEKKFKKLEKSFYSLYSLGCRPFGLNPMTIAFIYKQYCQSIFRYGLEFVHLTKTKIEGFNVRQNILIKRSIGLSKYLRTTPLFNCLKIESIQEIYQKHKIFLYKQIKANRLTSQIFDVLKDKYDKKIVEIDSESIFKQMNIIKSDVNVDCYLDPKKTIVLIKESSKCSNLGLLDSVKFIIENMGTNNKFCDETRLLASLLRY